jgi:hypothetical protein
MSAEADSGSSKLLVRVHHDFAFVLLKLKVYPSGEGQL